MSFRITKVERTCQIEQFRQIKSSIGRTDKFNARIYALFHKGIKPLAGLNHLIKIRLLKLKSVSPFFPLIQNMVKLNHSLWFMPWLVRTGLLVILISWFCHTASAQDAWGSEQPYAASLAILKTEWMVDSLRLSPLQSEKILHLNHQYASELEDALSHMDAGNWVEKRLVIQEHHARQDEAIRAILTSTQWDQYQRIKKIKAIETDRQKRAGK